MLLACDASPYGVAAVLSHRMQDGSERPLGYVSRSLSSAEKGYSQLDKEGLALVFGVTKFHKYLHGRHFVLMSDHKPLITLFHERKGIPAMSSARIQRWALTLASYEYTIEHRAGKDNVPADVFSRLPLPESATEEPIPEHVHLMETLSLTRFSGDDLGAWTASDPILSRVHRYLLTGWPTSDPDIQPYTSRKEELSVLQGVVLWGNRAVIPTEGRAAVLKELHEGHPGVSRMKALARSYVWWPGMDEAIVAAVGACRTCQAHQNTPAKAPMQPWDWPEQPWSRVHVDYAGPFLGHMFLVAMDAHSKWMEVALVTAANATQTIEKLRQMFATHGIPKTMVSDNGSPFVNESMSVFLRQNGVRHIRVAPYHPSSNGLAERAVQTFKNGMRCSQRGQSKLEYLGSYSIIAASRKPRQGSHRPSCSWAVVSAPVWTTSFQTWDRL